MKYNGHWAQCLWYRSIIKCCFSFVHFCLVFLFNFIHLNWATRCISLILVLYIIIFFSFILTFVCNYNNIILCVCHVKLQIHKVWWETMNMNEWIVYWCQDTDYPSNDIRYAKNRSDIDEVGQERAFQNGGVWVGGGGGGGELNKEGDWNLTAHFIYPN